MIRGIFLKRLDPDPGTRTNGTVLYGRVVQTGPLKDLMLRGSAAQQDI